MLKLMEGMLTPAFPLLLLAAITTTGCCFHHGAIAPCLEETTVSQELIQSLLKSRERFILPSVGPESFTKADCNMDALGIYHL